MFPNPLTRTALAAAGMALAGTVGYLAAASVGPSPAPRLTRVSTDGVSGPCDEAEHATDPRCTGSAVTSPAPRPGTSTPPPSTSSPAPAPSRPPSPGASFDDADGDVSGPGNDDDDHSGPGGGSDDD